MEKGCQNQVMHISNFQVVDFKKYDQLYLKAELI